MANKRKSKTWSSTMEMYEEVVAGVVMKKQHRTNLPWDKSPMYKTNRLAAAASRKTVS